MKDDFSHFPVLLDECIEGLNIRPGGSYLDGTVGGGGHAAEIAKRLNGGYLFCIDKDPDAVRTASARLACYPNAEVMRGDFRNARGLLCGKTKSIDGAILDLGVSSYQLDSPSRGFSYKHDGPLDMRMSQSGVTAAEIINRYSEESLRDIIFSLGEEKYAANIARKILQTRTEKPIETTAELARTVTSALPPQVRRKEKNPARKTFMALRITANDELEALKEGLNDIFGMLADAGRLCVITFHSLEDRIVKQFFVSQTQGCICPKQFPVCVCGNTPKARMINKKPVTASQREISLNKRARSAKLRILEKL